jgi:SAM-dependent methyltransferase
MPDHIASKAWNWEMVPSNTWNEVSDEFLPVALRWQKLGKHTVLDLGCGRGRHSIFLAEMGFNVTAVDLSPEGIAQLRQVAAEQKLNNIRTLVCDMLELPFDKESFDCVLAFHSIFHTDYRGLKSVIADITRFLKPSGQLFVTFGSKSNPSFKNPANRVVDDFTVIKTERLEVGVPHTYLDYADIPPLLSAYRLLKVRFIQGYYGSSYSCHYFVEAEKK